MSVVTIDTKRYLYIYGCHQGLRTIPLVSPIQPIQPVTGEILEADSYDCGFLWMNALLRISRAWWAYMYIFPFFSLFFSFINEWKIWHICFGKYPHTYTTKELWHSNSLHTYNQQWESESLLHPGKRKEEKEIRKDIHACPWIRDSQPRGFCWE